MGLLLSEKKEEYGYMFMILNNGHTKLITKIEKFLFYFLNFKFNLICVIYLNKIS